MELKLNKNQFFWALINPQGDNEVTLILNETEPTVSVDADKLPLWAKQQIVSSSKRGVISSKPELILEVNSTKKTTKKKAASKN